MYGITKDPEYPKQSGEKRTKLQQLKQHGIGIKKQIDQWNIINIIQSPETNSCIYGQLVHNKVAKNLQ